MQTKVSMLFTVVALTLAISIANLVAHPHCNKTITVTLPGGAEAIIAYNTTPANESHAREAAVGSFLTPRRPTLKLSVDVTAGSQVIPAGDYTIGVLKNGENDWTMALLPGVLARGQSPDTSKLIKLDSMFSSEMGTAPHMLIDISPGSGKFEGKAVLTLHFGSLFLAGSLS